MTRPRLLDLFCGAGGAAVGYQRAGFDVYGVDCVPQPHYPFTFHLGDAMRFPLDEFDAIHASPPCQAYSITKHSHGKQHPDLLPGTVARLVKHGAPWVVENVMGAPLPNATELCGASFGLTAVDDDGSTLVLKRHRLFASSHVLLAMPCACAWYRRAGIGVGGVYGGGSVDRTHAKNVRRGGYTPSKRVRGDLLGIDWMPMDRLSQAIPPAYTQFIGEQLLAHLGRAAA